MKSEIITDNKAEFKKDLKAVHDVLVFAPQTSDYLKITKGEILRTAKTNLIYYYLTDSVFKNKRTVMIIV